MRLSRISIAALLVALVATSGGCVLVNRVRAKNALNEGARAYREGQFAEAETKFRTAYELDPSQKNAPLFIARAIQQQYKPGVNTPENLAVGERAIKAHQCATDGLKLAEQAVALDPQNPNAWTQKANLLREKSKLAEMAGDTKAKEDFDSQAAKARETQAKLAEAAQKKKEAEEAAKAATPPPS